MSLKHVLLGFLVHEEQTGYDLAKSFDESIAYYWSASHQQIYRTLAELRDDQWVSVRIERQTQKPNKKLYSITEAGMSELRSWAVQPPKSGRAKNALLVKVLMIDVVGSQPIVELLKAELADAETEIRQYRTIEKEHFTPPPSDQDLRHSGMYLTLRYGIELTLTKRRWLKQSIKALTLHGDARKS